MTGKNRGAGIAFFLSGIPVQGIPGQFKIRLLRLHFGFLQTEKIRLLLLKIVQKSLIDASSQAVDIP